MARLFPTSLPSPRSFRTVFLAGALPLLLAVAAHTYLRVNQGSPENFYLPSESRLYVRNDLPTTRMLGEDPGYFFRKREPIHMVAGDLITAIDGHPVQTERALRTYLEDKRDDTSLVVTVQRPTRRDYFPRFRARVRDLLGHVDETPATLYVWHVPRGGASYEAGVRPGDLIHKINGRAFSDGAQANRMIARTLGGEKIAFGILRKGRLLVVSVTMARITIPLSLAFYLAVGCLWLGMGLFFGVFRAQLKTARLLAPGFFLMGCGLLLYAREDALLLPAVTGPLLFFLAVATLIHAGYYFPREIPRLLRVPARRRHAYALVPVASLLTLIFGRYGLGAGLLLMVLPQLFIRLRADRRRSRERALMETWLVNGHTFGVVSVLMWSLLAARMTVSWDLAVRGVTALIVLGGYGVTIARYRLLGVEIKRGLQYTLVIAGWWLLLLFALAQGLERLSYTHLNLLNINLTPGDIEFLNAADSPEELIRRQKLTVMCLSLLLGVAFWRLGLWGRRFLRRKFHRDPHDYLQAGTELKQVLDGGLGIAGIAEGIAENLRRLMLLKGAAVLIFEDEQRVAAHASAGLGDPEGFAVLAGDHAQDLVRALKPFQSELSTDFLGPHLGKALCAHGLRYICPFHTKNALQGCLIAGEKLSESAYAPRDFRFLAATAGQAAVAVENALLYARLSRQERLRHELALARRIQLASLPQTEPVIQGLDVSGTSLPALEVGGDYYAYFPIGEDRLTVVVADVSGKGTSAALYMSKMQGIFASLHDACHGVRDLFLKANPVLYRETDRQAFITALGAHFDMRARRVTFARAGHLPLLHYDAQAGTACRQTSGGLGLGMENNGMLARVLEERSLPLARGDVFLLLSDGLSEMQDATHQLFGEQRLLDLLAEHAHKSARAIRDTLLAEVNDFGPRDAAGDDQTLVVVKIR